MGEKIIQPPFYNSGFYNGRFYEGGGFYNGAGDNDYIEIDGHKYHYIKIGSLIWINENLILDIGDNVLYNEDISYGRYYAGYSINDINTYLTNNNPGWRVPSLSDANDLYNNSGSDVLAISQNLRSIDWDSGLDAFGFNCKPNGLYNFGSELFYDVGARFTIWTQERVTLPPAPGGWNYGYKSINITTSNANLVERYANWGLNVRICCNA